MHSFFTRVRNVHVIEDDSRCAGRLVRLFSAKRHYNAVYTNIVMLCAHNVICLYTIAIKRQYRGFTTL